MIEFLIAKKIIKNKKLQEDSTEKEFDLELEETVLLVLNEMRANLTKNFNNPSKNNQ
jgi:hypothetical protein